MLEAACLAWGFLISFVVQYLKRTPFVARYPKVVALIAGAISSVLLALPETAPDKIPLREIALCILVQFSTAVATYETVIKPWVRSGDS